jgi:serine kinase of HPr protein (carbohydrate metabolism regulator)
MPQSTIHASAVLCGHRGILIRGASGAGKSRLVLAILQAAGTGFARLIGDDRIHVQAAHGRLLLRPPAALQGLLEVRGLGVRRLPFEPVAVADLVIDLGVAEAVRLPEAADLATTIEGIALARLAVAPGADALPVLLHFLRCGKSGGEAGSPAKAC